MQTSTTYGQISTLGGTFSPVSGMHGRVLMKRIRITHYQIHMTPMRFWRSWVQRSRSHTAFLMEAYRLTVRSRRPSSCLLFC